MNWFQEICLKNDGKVLINYNKFNVKPTNIFMFNIDFEF